MSLPPGLSAYGRLSRALQPLAGMWLDGRLRAGKEDAARLGERYGQASASRPEGALVWLHGASVGEARMLLQVQAALAQERPDLFFLITTGTTTSAADIKAAAPARTIHQFAPLDVLDGAAERFIAHWRPDLSVMAESEFWPHLIAAAKRDGAPMALVNARISRRSLAHWRRFPQSARTLLDSYDLILAADRATAEGLSRLAGRPAPFVGNLKLAAPAPKADPTLLERLRTQIGARPVWLAASTHAGEDQIVLAAHARLRRTRADALLLIAPRHPARGQAVAALAGGAPRRSRGARIEEGPVFVVDTLGELGAFFRAAPIAFMGGSLLSPLRGHNPIEPAKCGAAVISGRHVESFADVYAELFAAGGAALARNPLEIAAAVDRLWADGAARRRQIAAADAVIADGAPALRRTAAALLSLLDPDRADAAA